MVPTGNFLVAWQRILLLAVVGAMVLYLSGCTNANTVTGAQTSLTGNDVLLEDETLPTSTQNLAPILQVSATQQVIGFNGEVVLHAEAIDPDGDVLKFSWIASEGVFIRQQTTQATWQAPEKSGPVNLSCMVTDGRGGTARGEVSVDVVGGRVYQVKVALNRSSLVIGKVEGDVGSEWVPVSQARVTLPEINAVAITDSSGIATIELDEVRPISSSSSVLVRYLDYEISFAGKFPGAQTTRLDSIQFYPGFDGVTVATARGDSFAGRLGSVEVWPVEHVNGEYRSISEVTVDVGPGQGIARSGVALLSPLVTSGQANLRLIKSGYEKIDGYQIPVVMDGVTLVRARMHMTGVVPPGDAMVAWTRPYNGQKSVKVTGPFEIGFGQAMETGTILDDFQVTLQETESRNTVVMSGPEIKERFDLVWEGTTMLRLIPKRPLLPLKRYSMLINRWTAHTADGRVLKNYTGMFGIFTTDADAAPSLTSTSPVNGDTNVSRSGPFVVRFDRPMNPGSLRNGLLIEVFDVLTGSKILVDHQNLDNEFSVLWTEENRVLTLVPRRVLKAHHPYRVRVKTTGLCSESGQAVEFIDNLWGQFSTGAL